MDDNSQTKKGAGSKLGIAVLNPVVLPGSTASHRKAVVDLKYGKLLFKGLACEQVEGEEPKIQKPWDTELVEIPIKGDHDEINEQVLKKVGKVLADLKHSDTKGRWGNVS